MDITNKIQAKLTKLLKRLKNLGIIQNFILEMTFCQVEEGVKKNLIEIDSVLKKCLRKIISKPCKAEIRNVITELVRKKNLNHVFIADKPVKDTLLVTKLEESYVINDPALKFQCDLCEDLFNSEKNLKMHKKKHKKTEKYLCEKCGKVFCSIQNLLKHQSDFKEVFVVPVKMKNLSENISSELAKNNNDSKLLPELQKKKEIIYESSRSTVVMESKCSIQKNNTGSQVAKKPNTKFICACGKIFQVLKTLKRHEKIKHSITSIQHKCITCGKCFTEKGKLNRHILSHNDYQYSCSFCLKQFSRSDTLKRHIALFHFSSRKFTCSFCQKKFSLKYNRDIHEKNIHKNSRNQVQCDYCGNKFKNKATLKSHFKSHFESRITCMACRKSFRKKSYFEIHMKTKHFGNIPCASDSVAL